MYCFNFKTQDTLYCDEPLQNHKKLKSLSYSHFAIHSTISAKLSFKPIVVENQPLSDEPLVLEGLIKDAKTCTLKGAVFSINTFFSSPPCMPFNIGYCLHTSVLSSSGQEWKSACPKRKSACPKTSQNIGNILFHISRHFRIASLFPSPDLSPVKSLLQYWTFSLLVFSDMKKYNAEPRGTAQGANVQEVMCL